MAFIVGGGNDETGSYIKSFYGLLIDNNKALQFGLS